MTPANTVVSPYTSQLRPLTDLLSWYVLFFQYSPQGDLTFCLACVANVSVQYSVQRTRNESQRQRFISRAAKTENPVPQSFFFFILFYFY